MAYEQDLDPFVSEEDDAEAETPETPDDEEKGDDEGEEGLE